MQDFNSRYSDTFKTFYVKNLLQEQNKKKSQLFSSEPEFGCIEILTYIVFFTVLCGMLMTACDVSAIAKPWEQQHLLAKRVADEFFDQGDLEKLRLNTQPIVSDIIKG